MYEDIKTIISHKYTYGDFLWIFYTTNQNCKLRKSLISQQNFNH